MARHARCDTCYRKHQVRVDGTLFKHQRAGEPCQGSEKSVTR